ncbi:hypothetical protein [Streptomyces sp. NPDC046821]|uniref:hypothetical protein n=1 Tax=Streptomyces sp. NPDC046821 TaxID=3154702 RepID=UPI0033FF580B
MGDRPGTSKDVQEKPKEKRLDLSVPQVAGSAVAAVVAAKLASGLGVYGTIVGAGVVSALATCGGTIFQHFFRRTGEQIRDVAGQAIPKSRQIPVAGDGRQVPATFRSGVATASAGTEGVATRMVPLPKTTTWGVASATRDLEATTVLPAARGGEATTVLPASDADATTVVPASDADATTVLSAERADETTVLPAPDADKTTVLPAQAAEETTVLRAPDSERTMLLKVGAGDPEKTQLLGTGGVDNATRVLRAIAAPSSDASGAELPPPAGDLGEGSSNGPGLTEEFTEATTHRASVRSWRRPLVAAAVVFGITMAGITTYELASGQSFNGDGQRTTLREAFTGGGGSSSRHDHTPAPDTSQQPSDGAGSATPSGTPQSGGGAWKGGTAEPTPTPTGSGDSGTGSGTGSGAGAAGDKSTAAPTPSATGTSTPTATPSASESGSTTLPGLLKPGTPTG